MHSVIPKNTLSSKIKLITGCISSKVDFWFSCCSGSNGDFGDLGETNGIERGDFSVDNLRPDPGVKFATERFLEDRGVLISITLVRLIQN